MFQNIISSHQCFYSSVNNVSGALPWTPCCGRPAVDALLCSGRQGGGCSLLANSVGFYKLDFPGAR